MSIVFKILLIVLFACMGYLYYLFVGCRTGMCPITANPFMSTGYGALVGAVIGFVLIPSFKKKPSKD